MLCCTRFISIWIRDSTQTVYLNFLLLSVHFHLHQYWYWLENFQIIVLGWVADGYRVIETTEEWILYNGHLWLIPIENLTTKFSFELWNDGKTVVIFSHVVNKTGHRKRFKISTTSKRESDWGTEEEKSGRPRSRWIVLCCALFAQGWIVVHNKQ